MDIVIIDDTGVDFDRKYGLDGQYFELPLNTTLNEYDVIIHNECTNYLIVQGIKENNIHVVSIFYPETIRFFPGKFLKAGTIFKILK